MKQKRITGSYVYWHNWKYQRTGHLFKDRFKNEEIEDDEYLLTTIRYIHQNPIKSEKYVFNGYHVYLSENSYIIDKNFIFPIMNKKHL